MSMVDLANAFDTLLAKHTSRVIWKKEIAEAIIDLIKDVYIENERLINVNAQLLGSIKQI